MNASNPTTTIPTAKAALALNGLAAIGGTTVADLRNAFTDAFNFDPNVIIPLWSNKSTGMQAAGRPDAGIDRGVDFDSHLPSAYSNGITYLVAGAQLQSHLVERSSVTVRKEAQGFFRCC